MVKKIDYFNRYLVIKMNIFFLSMSIMRCAKSHFDKHVIKMILEYCQLLSTAWHILDPYNANIHLNNGLIYKKTHFNHPCAVWVRKHINNYNYVARLGIQLCHEWRFRYKHNKIHGSESKLIFLYNNPPKIDNYYIDKTKKNPKSLSLPLPQAMPDKYKINKKSVHSAVNAYRNYYKSDDKKHIANWTIKNNKTRELLAKPYWW